MAGEPTCRDSESSSLNSIGSRAEAPRLGSRAVQLGISLDAAVALIAGLTGQGSLAQ
jgi:hypothetical protein